MEDRLLIRRRVTVTTEDGTRPPSIIELTRWEDGVNERWDTTSVASGTYSRTGSNGYLTTTPVAGTATMYDCVSASGDHYPAQNCPEMHTKLRTIGYVWTAVAPGTIPLYRCKTSAGDNFVSTDVACEGHTLRWTAGWVLPKTVL